MLLIFVSLAKSGIDILFACSLAHRVSLLVDVKNQAVKAKQDVLNDR